MLLKVRGTPVNLDADVVGRVRRSVAGLTMEDILILEHDEWPEEEVLSKIVLLTTRTLEPTYSKLKGVWSVTTFDYLQDGDIVIVHPNGLIQTLYRVHSRQNFLLVTEMCNSNCLMCSQPPKDRDDVERLHAIHEKLMPLIPKDCESLGITGGEPTLLGDRFFELLSIIRDNLPHAEVHCLTNGRLFADRLFAQRLGSLDFTRLMLGIPLYSDFYQTHDYVVQAKGAFDETILGLYQLAHVGVRLEIRIVLQLSVIPRLVKLAKFIYLNLPFVEHVTFMGLEYQGYTPHNIAKLWIDPTDYANELGEAVEFLSLRGMNVSIYNLQLCLVPRSLWGYCRKSISDWKNIYLSACEGCAVMDQCGGFFASSERYHSEHIRPISSSTTD